MVTGPGTTRTQADMGLRDGSMGHTAVLALAHGITRVQGRILGALLPMVHTEHAARRKLITRAPALTPRPDRVPVSTGVGDRRTCNAETIGQTQNDSRAAPATRRVLLAQTTAA